MRIERYEDAEQNDDTPRTALLCGMPIKREKDETESSI